MSEGDSGLGPFETLFGSPVAARNRQRTTDDAAVGCGTESTTEGSPDVPAPSAFAPRERRFKSERRCVYFVLAIGLGLIKIGVANNAHARFLSLRSGSPDELKFLGMIRDNDAERLEVMLHSNFRDDRVRGEWFAPSEALLGFIERNAMSIEEDYRREMAAAVAMVSRPIGAGRVCKTRGG